MKYFISYSDNVMSGTYIYNTIIEREKPITSIEDIRDIEKLIAKKLRILSSKHIYVITFKEINNGK